MPGSTRARRGSFLAVLAAAFAFSSIAEPQTEDQHVRQQLPGYAGLAVREGYLRGAGDVRLRYRLVSGTRVRETIVFVHGGPGSGMSNGSILMHALLGGIATLQAALQSWR